MMIVLFYFDALILCFCIFFLLDLLDLILFNLGAVGEPFFYVLEGETIFETPTAAEYEWGAGDVADHVAH